MRNRQNSTVAAFLEAPMKMGKSCSVICLLKSSVGCTMPMVKCQGMDSMYSKRQCWLRMGLRVPLERLKKQLQHTWQILVVEEVVGVVEVVEEVVVVEVVVVEEVMVVEEVVVVEVAEELVGDKEEVVMVEVMIVDKVRRRYR